MKTILMGAAITIGTLFALKNVDALNPIRKAVDI